MAGRITYRRPRQSDNVSTEIEPLKTATRQRLEAALGRTLTPEECKLTERTIAGMNFWRNIARTRTSAEDCRATIAALAKENDAVIVRAFDAADHTTRAHVNAHVPGVRAADPSCTREQEIRKAARKALAALHDQRGPRVTHLRKLADDATWLWRELKGKRCAAAAKAEYATPIVQFTQALLEAAGEFRSPSAIAKLLRDKFVPGK